MKKDWDAIRDILIKAEDLEQNKNLTLNDFDEAQHNLIIHQVVILENAGFIQAIIPRTTAGINEFYLTDITFSGHELLNMIKNDGVWQKIKSYIKEKNVELSFEAIMIGGKYILNNLLN